MKFFCQQKQAGEECLLHKFSVLVGGEHLSHNNILDKSYSHQY